MGKIFVTVILSVAVSAAAAAQEPVNYDTVDSLVFVPVSAVDTTLRGSDILSVMPDCVNVEQSAEIRNGLNERKINNYSKNVQGFRIRIFFDNGRDARSESQAVMYKFKTRYPGVSAYRTFTSPFFKVTVGDFRTRSEALAMLSEVSRLFPSAFIVKESFKYPSFGTDEAFRVDTVKVRHLKPSEL